MLIFCTNKNDVAHERVQEVIITNLAIYITDIIALVFLLVLLRYNIQLNSHHTRLFSYGIIFTVFVIIAEIGAIAAYEAQAELRNLNIFFNVIGFSLTPVIPIVLTAIFARTGAGFWMNV